MLTVLTQPVQLSPAEDCTFFSRPSLAVRRLVQTVFPRKPVYGGHPAVSRSVVEGMARLRVPYRYNPSDLNQVSEIVIVLAGLEALQQAIGWKRERKINVLVAGPNIVVRPTEGNSLLASPEVDLCLVPSEWVRIAYLEDTPSLAGRISVWAAGVDERYWNRSRLNRLRRQRGRKTVLVYWKDAPADLGAGVEALLNSLGWHPVRITYGHYDREQYRAALEASAFAVFLSGSESQGIALAEAWAMNVPTLVWNPESLTYQGRRYTVASSCPWLTEDTGIGWVSLTEFERILTKVRDSIESWKPREWILRHMTDEAAARNLLQIISRVAVPRHSARTVEDSCLVHKMGYLG
jgi:hypothetical protein